MIDRVNNNLLVLSHSYSNFVKDPVENISPFFNDVNVLVRINPVAELSNYIPFNFLKPYTIKAKIDISNKPNNIHVIPSPIIYLPIDAGYKSLLNRHFKVCDNILNQYNIKYNLIHSHFVISAGYVGAKLKEKYGVPLIVTAHGYDVYDLPFKDETWAEKIKYTLNMADYILTVSNKNLECINKLNINAPVKIIPNGYNNNLFYPMNMSTCRSHLNLPIDKKIILNIGILEDIKGQHFLIDSINELVKLRKDILCIIIGEGHLKNKLQKQIDHYGLASNIKLIGGRPHSEIPLWINACDLFVLSSITESFGLVQIEAMACGKPVVATRNGGSEEIIISDEYGLLCNIKDYKSLATRISMALEKNWNSEIITDYAKKYGFDNITSDILTIYNKVLDKNSDITH